MTAADRDNEPVRLSISLQGPEPIYEQIYAHIADLIATGGLQPGDRMPSVRQLAADLRINRNTAARAYKDLERTRLIETRHGGGTRIAALVLAWSEKERERRVASAVKNLCQEAAHLGVGPDEVRARVHRELQREGPAATSQREKARNAGS